MKKGTQIIYSFILSVLFFLSVTCVPLKAEVFNSTSFQVLDPVLFPASFATSTSFMLWSTMGEMSLGTSTSIGNTLVSGFLPYPIATSPIISSTAGNGAVSHTWTASNGFWGWTPTSYEVGYSTVSGGPYTFTSFGNNLNGTTSGLSNGTLYYFVVIVKDALSNTIATSTQVTATPTQPTPPSIGGGGGGGGGGFSSPVTQSNSVSFTGKAYPFSDVTLLRDSVVVGVTKCDAVGVFNINASIVSTGNYTFSFYSDDDRSIRSSLLAVPVNITTSGTIYVHGVFLSPTIAINKSQVKKGDDIVIYGQSVPQATVSIVSDTGSSILLHTVTDADGHYVYTFNTSELPLGNYYIRAKSTLLSETSSASPSVSFIVGTQNVLSEDPIVNYIRGDFNEDRRVNLIDYSIASYWYKRKTTPEFNVIEKRHSDGNGTITLTDFSIIAFNWTG